MTDTCHVSAQSQKECGASYRADDGVPDNVACGVFARDKSVICDNLVEFSALAATFIYMAVCMLTLHSFCMGTYITCETYDDLDPGSCDCHDACCVTFQTAEAHGL